MRGKIPLSPMTISEVFCPKQEDRNILMRDHSKINTILSTHAIKKRAISAGLSKKMVKKGWNDKEPLILNS
jgi:hypothetical protein